MKFEVFSYRFAAEILQHEKHIQAWKEITESVQEAPLFVYPGKSKKNARLDVVQQLQNAFFDRKFAIDLGWDFHPVATKIPNSNLKADFRKDFNGLSVQTEVQFGNMSRWYTDIFKFQAAYSESLIQIGVSIVPMTSLARRIDSNVVNFERATRELPSAKLSITLPILLLGVYVNEKSKVTNVANTQFEGIGEITGRGKLNNRWRIIEAHFKKRKIESVSEKSPTGPTLEQLDEDEEDSQ